jgi:hypothetical protein
MTSGFSMKAMIHMALPQRSQMRGSTSYTCLISRAQARFAAALATSLKFSMLQGPSPLSGAFRSFPRLTLL